METKGENKAVTLNRIITGICSLPLCITGLYNKSQFISPRLDYFGSLFRVSYNLFWWQQAAVYSEQALETHCTHLEQVVYS